MVTNDDLQPVDPALQIKMNEPPVDPDGFTPEAEAFVRDVMSKVFSGEINLYTPATLLNQNVYQTVDEAIQGKADLIAINFCSKLREIRELMEISGGDQMYVKPTYQLNLLVEELKYRKEEFEKLYGNLLII